MVLPTEDQAKILNLSYRPYFNGYPSQVVFRLRNIRTRTSHVAWIFWCRMNRNHVSCPREQIPDTRLAISIDPPGISEIRLDLKIT